LQKSNRLERLNSYKKILIFSDDFMTLFLPYIMYIALAKLCFSGQRS
jgi:hypothetical protein